MRDEKNWKVLEGRRLASEGTMVAFDNEIIERSEELDWGVLGTTDKLKNIRF